MIKAYYQKRPFRTILFVALALRLLAAIFSEGYAFHDDHFDVTRVANSWANGIPFWLEDGIPPKHSMLYAGINAGIIWLAEAIGLSDPYHKTMLMRLLHAFYSMLIVYLGIRITQTLTDDAKAKMVGWILALLWFMPFMGVRFLVEMTSIPPIMAGFYILIKCWKEENYTLLNWLAAGALFGLAFALRYHTILFAGGLGLVLLYRQQWTGSVFFTLGYLMAAFITVGLIDLILFDYPFHSIVEYFRFNSEHANNFIKGSPFKFTLTTFGFLVPPVSVFLMIGFFTARKVEPMMFLAVFAFFIFHSSFPNQQERFILPMFPMLIILGTIGWYQLMEESVFLKKYVFISSFSWKFFWTINLIGGLFMCLTFSKKDRIAPLHYLYSKGDAQSVIIENERSVKMPPVFYLGNNYSDYNEWDEGILGLDEATKKADSHYAVFSFPADKKLNMLKAELLVAGKRPNYIIMQGLNNMEERQARIDALLDGKTLTFETEITPSGLDRLLHFFNPRIHRDQTARIYKIN